MKEGRETMVGLGDDRNLLCTTVRSHAEFWIAIAPRRELSSVCHGEPWVSIIHRGCGFSDLQGCN
jgi:hypothetical protein